MVFRGYVVEVFEGVSRKSGKPYRRLTLSGSLYWSNGDGDPVRLVRLGDLEQFLPDFASDLAEGELIEVPISLSYSRGGKVGGEYIQPSLSLRFDWRNVVVEGAYAGA